MAVIGQYGDSVTQTVNGVFPDGGIGNLAGYAMKAANTALGAGVMNHIMDASTYIQKKLWGGALFPGTVYVQDDQIRFEPSFFIKLPLYQGFSAIAFPYSDISSVEKVRKGPLRIAGVKINVGADHFLIMAPFDSDKIMRDVGPFVRTS